MILYLCQHGEAKPEKEDPDRSLTAKGRSDIKRVAEHLKLTNVHVPLILHSGKQRAKETAEILATSLRPIRGIKEVAGLNPLDDPQKILDLINNAQEPLMIVGHLPHLGYVASLLLLGSKEKEVIKFSMGGVVALVRGNKGWLIDWIVKPENLPGDF